MTNFDVEPYYDKLIELTKSKSIIWSKRQDNTYEAVRNEIPVILESMGFTACGCRFYYTGNENKHNELLQLVSNKVYLNAIEIFLKD